jgi:hypothetical protein
VYFFYIDICIHIYIYRQIEIHKYFIEIYIDGLIDLLYKVFYMQESLMDHHGMEVDQQPTDSNLP